MNVNEIASLERSLHTLIEAKADCSELLKANFEFLDGIDVAAILEDESLTPENLSYIWQCFQAAYEDALEDEYEERGLTFDPQAEWGVFNSTQLGL